MSLCGRCRAGGALAVAVAALVVGVLSMTAGGSRAAAAPAGPAGPSPVSVNVRAGQVYGVGLPVVVTFTGNVPDNERRQVAGDLSVRSQPAQTGAWRWYGNRELIYRPRGYWQPGTRLTVHTGLRGVPVAGQHIEVDRTVSAAIGGRQTVRIDHGTKRLQVFQDDRLVKTFPASLGKPETPSSSGQLVIMEKLRAADWVYSATDTLHVEYAERLTADGEFIHAAPWSVTDQGHDNVSHGCTNVSTSDGAWLYQHTRIGDPVTVVGTEKHVAPDNGWTVWDMSWSQYVRGASG
jgi:lipoprotein-anchoring transpeptidase ErfK/SrfK